MAKYIEQADYVVSQIQDSAQNRLVVIEHVLNVLDSQLVVITGLMGALNYDVASIKVDETPAP